MTPEDCRHCALELKETVAEQATEIAVLNAKVDERDKALQLATENMRLGQSQTWLKTVAVIGWILAAVGIAVNLLK